MLFAVLGAFREGLSSALRMIRSDAWGHRFASIIDKIVKGYLLRVARQPYPALEAASWACCLLIDPTRRRISPFVQRGLDSSGDFITKVTRRFEEDLLVVAVKRSSDRCNGNRIIFP